MADYPKAIKRLLREFNGIAYERELHRAFKELDENFAAWRAEEIDSVELAECVHRFERGPARELYSFYFGDRQRCDRQVAYAIAVGVIDPDEAPPELLSVLADRIERHKTRLQAVEPPPPEE